METKMIPGIWYTRRNEASGFWEQVNVHENGAISIRRTNTPASQPIAVYNPGK